jgi:hypothetical protein
LQEDIEEDDEMEEDLSDALEDDMEVEESKPQKKKTPYESDSEDPEADEAEEAYLAELSSTTSHLQVSSRTISIRLLHLKFKFKPQLQPFTNKNKIRIFDKNDQVFYYQQTTFKKFL